MSFLVMARINLNFDELSPLEQEWFLTETRCDKCNEADLGIVDPVYYREDGKEFIEGKCKKCGALQITEIVVQKLK